MFVKRALKTITILSVIILVVFLHKKQNNKTTLELITMESIPTHTDRGRYHRRLPNAIIFGVQKGGTETLKDFLNLNPDIRITEDEEINFFNDNYKKGKAWYIGKMPKAFDNEIVIDKSPNYFHTRYVPKRVAETLGSNNVKLLGILRDPVRRTVSNYAHSLDHHRTTDSFRNLVMSRGHVNPDSSLVMKGLYDVHLARWYQHFPKENVLLLDGDRFAKDPIPILNQAEKFLGVPSFISDKNVVFSKSKGFYCKLIKEETKCQPPSKGRKHEHIANSVMNALYQFFKPHNQKLPELTGVNFTFVV